MKPKIYTEFDKDKHTTEDGICESCGEELAPIMEDMHPDGIGYYEVVGYKPCPCRLPDPYDEYIDSQIEEGGERDSEV